MKDPGTSDDLLERLVAACLERRGSEGAATAAAVCTAHPDLQPDVERLLSILDGLGLGAGEDTIDATVPAAQLLPRAFGRFRLLELLGSGGMGAVYLAEDVELGRRVALKLIRGEFLHDPKARSRFRREIEVLARLDHPHLCTIHEAGETEGQPWIAMRLVPGQPVRDVLAGEAAAAAPGPAAPRTSTLGAWPRLVRWLAVLEQAARAVHHAHESGLVHRDLKPGNLMLAPTGDVVVLDFGLAREETDATGLTATDDRLGTLAYMAPEQVEPRGRRVDRRTDVYALGVALYEALTLSLPYEAKTAAELERCIAAGARVAARRRVPRLPPEVDWVLDRALDVDPGRRYATALDLAEDLHRLREREPVVARRQSTMLRLRRWTQRNPMAAALTTVLALGLGSSLVLLVRGDRALLHAKVTSLVRASELAERSDRELSLLLALEADRLDPRPDTLDQLNRAVRGSELRWRSPPFEGSIQAVAVASQAPRWAAVSLHEIRVFEGTPPAAGRLVRQRRWATDVPRLHAIALAPDGKLALVGAGPGRPFLWNVEEDSIIDLPGHEGGWMAVAFSPDGERCYTWGMEGRLFAWNTQGQPLHRGGDGKAKPLHEQRGRALGTLTVLPDGSLLVARVGPTLRLEAEGKLIQTLDRSIVDPDHIALATDRVITTGPRTDSPVRLQTLDGTLVKELCKGSRQARFSPDGQLVLTADGDCHARLWDAVRGETIAQYSTDGAELFGAEFGLDGETILARTMDFRVHVFERRGHRRQTISIHGHVQRCFAYHPDGQHLIYGNTDGVVRVYQFAGPQPLPALSAPIVNFPPSPHVEGHHDVPLLTTDSGPIEWNVLTGRLRRLEMAERIPFSTVRMASSPDGNLLFLGAPAGFAALGACLDRRTGELVGRIPAGDGDDPVAVGGAAFLDDERVLIAHNVRRDHHQKLETWRLVPPRMELEHEWIAPQAVDPIERLALSRDRSRVVATTKRGSLFVWRLTDAPRGYVEERHDTSQASLLSVAIDGTGARVAAGTPDGRILRLGPGANRLTWSGHERAVNVVRFADDDRLVITASEDGTARIWDADTGDAHFTLRAGNGAAMYDAILFRAGPPQRGNRWAGLRAFTVSADQRGDTWLLDPLEIRRLAESLVTREMTEGERRMYEVR